MLNLNKKKHNKTINIHVYNLQITRNKIYTPNYPTIKRRYLFKYLDVILPVIISMAASCIKP